ncbi:MAG: hypothetical protein Tsb002_23490 [Wenzhouxiangellaceae bacterium]
MNMKALTTTVTTPFTEKFIASILRMLRPVARLALGRMTGTLLLDLMRRVLVEEAWRQLQRDKPGKVTLSEVALLTGMDSRMVKQLIKTPLSCTEEDISREAMVLARWKNDPEFINDNGEPARLLIFGPGATFQGLVTRVAGRNVTVQTVLDRLLRNNNVKVHREHWLDMQSHYYNVIEDDEERMLESGSTALQNLGDTLAHNLAHRDDPGARWIQQRRWSTTLPADRVESLRRQMDQLLRRQIDEATRTIEAHENAGLHDLNQPMVGVGYYYWEGHECGDTRD